MPKKSRLNGGAKANPGQVKTGLSRAVILSLSEGPGWIDEILERLGPRSGGVSAGTIWTILDRARNNGLVRREKRGRIFFYELTDGGYRRVAWIKGAKAARRPRAVANPGNKPKSGNGEEE